MALELEQALILPPKLRLDSVILTVQACVSRCGSGRVRRASEGGRPG